MPRRTGRELPPFADDDEEDDGFDDDEPMQLFMQPIDQATNLVALTNAARELIDYIKSTDVAEVRVESGPVKITVKRAAAMPPASVPTFMPQTAYAEAVLPTPAAPTEPATSAPTEAALHPNAHPIVSPMVGTFYHAPNPKDRPYISEGQRIEKGQIIGLIEAMKMMNEIDADISGTVLKIVATNGQPVEYGQPLVLIEPDGQ